MAKILILAKSGFGKTTALCGRKKFGIEGLNPAETFLIQCANRELANLDYKLIDGVTSADSLKNVIGNGNRIQVGNISGLEKFKTVAKAIEMLAQSPFKNIVIDDFNYIMQNWYMANALSKGWDAPKQIGFFMGKIFDAIEKLDQAGKNIFVLAHGEPVPAPDGRIYLKMKTTGKMVA